MLIINHIGAVKSQLSYPIYVSGVRDTISKKANCMYSNLTIITKISKQKIPNLLKENRHNSHREITITVATHVDFI